MDDKTIDDRTLDVVIAALKAHAIKLHSIYLDQSEAKWLRDEAHDLWQGYKDAAAFVSNLKGGGMTTERDKTLREIIAWCEQVADEECDMYRAAYGDDRQAIEVRGAYWVVAAHCREMLEQPTQEDAK